MALFRQRCFDFKVFEESSVFWHSSMVFNIYFLSKLAKWQGRLKFYSIKILLFLNICSAFIYSCLIVTNQYTSIRLPTGTTLVCKHLKRRKVEQTTKALHHYICNSMLRVKDFIETQQYTIMWYPFNNYGRWCFFDTNSG